LALVDVNRQDEGLVRALSSRITGLAFPMEGQDLDAFVQEERVAYPAVRGGKAFLGIRFHRGLVSMMGGGWGSAMFGFDTEVGKGSIFHFTVN